MTRRTAAALLLVIAAVAACSKGAPTVDPSFTRAQAQDRLVTLLSDTLGLLPPGLSLAFTGSDPGSGSLGPGIVVPCVDDNTVDHPPLNLQLSYWVNGAGAGSGPDLLRSVGDSFRSRGWDTKPDGDRIVRGYSPDGYAVVGQLSSRGAVSLAGSTPCFPAANQAATTPEPSTIPHP